MFLIKIFAYLKRLCRADLVYLSYSLIDFITAFMVGWLLFLGGFRTIIVTFYKP